MNNIDIENVLDFGKGMFFFEIKLFSLRYYILCPIAYENK